MKYQLKSSSLSYLNEFLRNLELQESITIIQKPILTEEGEFISELDSENEIAGNNSVSVDSVDSENKDDMIDDFKEKLKDLLDKSIDLDNIVKKMSQLDQKTSNEWKLNHEGNDVYLQSKDAHIFKQNDSLLLSHDGEIEIFATVQELHDWLRKNNYPMTPSIDIHESTTEQILNRLDEAIGLDNYDNDTVEKVLNSYFIVDTTGNIFVRDVDFDANSYDQDTHVITNDFEIAKMFDNWEEAETQLNELIIDYPELSKFSVKKGQELIDDLANVNN